MTEMTEQEKMAARIANENPNGTEMTGNSESGTEQKENEYTDTVNGFNIQFFSLSEAMEYPKPEYLIDGYLFKNTLSALTGAGGSYKTFIALAEIIGLTTGSPIFGFAVPAPHKVAFLSLEMSLGSVAERLYKMLDREKIKAVEQNLIIIPQSGNEISYQKKESIDALIRLCVEHGADVLYIDAFADLMCGYDISSDRVKVPEAVIYLRNKAQRNGITIRMIMHATKPNMGQSTSAGIHEIRDQLDALFMVTTKEKEVTITTEKAKNESAKARDDMGMTKILRVESDENSFRFVEVEGMELNDNVQMAKKILEAVTADQGISATALRTVVGGSGRNYDTFTLCLNNLIRGGNIRAVKEGRSFRYFVD